MKLNHLLQSSPLAISVSFSLVSNNVKAQTGGLFTTEEMEAVDRICAGTQQPPQGYEEKKVPEGLVLR